MLPYAWFDRNCDHAAVVVFEAGLQAAALASEPLPRDFVAWKE